MKFSKSSQLALVSAAALGLATLLTACDAVTVDYLYVATAHAISSSNAEGQIDAYEVDATSGALRQLSSSPFPSGGAGPVAMVVNPDYKSLYVANGGDSTSGGNTIERFTIGTDGKLYPQQTVTPPGTLPVAMAMDNGGNYLYVAQKYGNVSGCGSLAPCSGGLAVIPLSSDGSFTSTTTTDQSFYSISVSGSDDVITPTAIAALPVSNSVGTTTSPAVYMTAYDYTVSVSGSSSLSCPVIPATGLSQCGYVFGYTNNSGTLTAMAVQQAGVKPSGIAATPNGSWVYVTDYSSGQMIGYGVSSAYALQVPATVKTGSQPTAITIDPRGSFIYVANGLDSTVSAFAIVPATGAATAVVDSTTASTDTQPTAIIVDPSIGRFVYTANYLGNTVTGFQLNPNDGTIVATQNTPYTTNSEPTALAAVPHGNHASIAVQK